jgi:NADH dehydrogenase
MSASHHSRTRFFRAKALAQEAVEASPLETTIFAPSIVYTPGDPWLTLLDRLSRLPAMPVSGSGRAAYEPIWAEDVAAAVMAALSNGASGTYDLAGPEILTYDDIVRTVLRAAHRRRRLVHIPLPIVRSSLRLLRRVGGPKVFATWEEAELMEEPMVSERGTADPEALGVKPLPMSAVLGV